MTNLDSILKQQRHYFAKKGLSSQGYFPVMVFPVVMYGYESWTIKKAEHRRTDALEPLCVVPSSTGLPSKRCPGIGFLGKILMSGLFQYLIKKKKI